MREAKEISDIYIMNRLERVRLKEEWNLDDSSWKKGYHIDGKKKLSNAQYIMCMGVVSVIFLVMLLLIPSIQSYIMGPELANNKIYSCPNGDWSGNTSQMIQTSDSVGGVYLHCPIDGKLIGHMSKNVVPIPEMKK